MKWTSAYKDSLGINWCISIFISPYSLWSSPLNYKPSSHGALNTSGSPCEWKSSCCLLSRSAFIATRSLTSKHTSLMEGGTSDSTYLLPQIQSKFWNIPLNASILFAWLRKAWYYFMKKMLCFMIIAATIKKNPTTLKRVWILIFIYFF